VSSTDGAVDSAAAVATAARMKEAESHGSTRVTGAPVDVTVELSVCVDTVVVVIVETAPLVEVVRVAGQDVSVV